MEGKKKKTQGQFKPTIENMQQQSLKQKDKKKTNVADRSSQGNELMKHHFFCRLMNVPSIDAEASIQKISVT